MTLWRWRSIANRVELVAGTHGLTCRNWVAWREGGCLGTLVLYILPGGSGGRATTAERGSVLGASCMVRLAVRWGDGEMGCGEM